MAHLSTLLIVPLSKKMIHHLHQHNKTNLYIHGLFFLQLNILYFSDLGILYSCTLLIFTIQRVVGIYNERPHLW